MPDVLSNQGGGGSAASGSLAIAADTQVNTDFATEGDIDWYAMTTNQNPPRTIGAASVHSKITGGWIRDSFMWVFAGQSMSLDQAAAGSTISAPATDNTANAAIVGSSTKGRIFHLSSPGTGWGFVLKVPALTTQRVLRVGVAQFSDVMRWTASLGDSSASPVSVDTDSGTGASLTKIIRVTFRAGAPCDLVFKGINFSRYTADPNLSFGWASLSTT